MLLGRAGHRDGVVAVAEMDVGIISEKTAGRWKLVFSYIYSSLGLNNHTMDQPPVEATKELT